MQIPKQLRIGFESDEPIVVEVVYTLMEISQYVIQQNELAMNGYNKTKMVKGMRFIYNKREVEIVSLFTDGKLEIRYLDEKNQTHKVSPNRLSVINF